MLGMEDEVKKEQLKKLIAMLNEKILDHSDDLEGDDDRGLEKLMKEEDEGMEEKERLPEDEHRREDEEEESEHLEKKEDQEGEDLGEDLEDSGEKLMEEEGEDMEDEGDLMGDDISDFLSGRVHQREKGGQHKMMAMDPKRASVKSMEIVAELPKKSLKKKKSKKKSKK